MSAQYDSVPSSAGVPPGLSRLLVPVELSSKDFSEIVSHLLRVFDHLLTLPVRWHALHATFPDR